MKELEKMMELKPYPYKISRNGRLLLNKRLCPFCREHKTKYVRTYCCIGKECKNFVCPNCGEFYYHFDTNQFLKQYNGILGERPKGKPWIEDPLNQYVFAESFEIYFRDRWGDWDELEIGVYGLDLHSFPPTRFVFTRAKRSANCYYCQGLINKKEYYFAVDSSWFHYNSIKLCRKCALELFEGNVLFRIVYPHNEEGLILEYKRVEITTIKELFKNVEAS